MVHISIECKQCGGQVPYESGKQVLGCPYCGSLNTVSKLFDTQAGLYNRANYLRRNSEFDKALAIYEEILRIDNTDYEAHWGMALCKYGIEYVQDPETGERIPTCHRAENESILCDLSYRAAIEFAPPETREVYQKEALQIDNIQKHIIALANREEKYDVFICYKEADGNGNRTEDSVIAQELQFELSKRGYKVFFARKALEGKLGSAYEPIIFAALNSAKVMVVLGTKPENFSAVWVKNEWSRYLELIRKGAKKTLVPAYRGMSPYDMPQEFSNLQALDMSRLGFMQDLCDGIDKLTRESKRPAAAPGRGNAPDSRVSATEPLLKRAYMFIEEGNFENANTYLERVLDADPEEARAYFGKLMTELAIRNEEQLPGRIYYEFAKRLLDILADLDFKAWINPADKKAKKRAAAPDYALQQYNNNAGWVLPAVNEAANKAMQLSNYENYNKAVRFAAPDLKEKYQEYQDTVSGEIRQWANMITDTFEKQKSLDKSFIQFRLPELWQMVEAEKSRRQEAYKDPKIQEALKQGTRYPQQANVSAPQPTPAKTSGSGCANAFFLVLGIIGVIGVLYFILR